MGSMMLGEGGCGASRGRGRKGAATSGNTASETMASTEGEGEAK